MQKKIVQIIFRSQKPEIIRINGILPALSLRYYAGVRMLPYTRHTHAREHICIHIYILLQYYIYLFDFYF